MSIDVTIVGGAGPEVSVNVPSVAGVLTLNGLAGAVSLAVVGGSISAAGNTITITVTGGGASSWGDLTGKPFTTLGTGLVVVAGVLSATGLAIADTTGLQAALEAKAPLASPTFTGTVSGVTKAMVGLSAVDNTADASKPVSTAQSNADAVVQAYAVQRSNHTGTQAVGTITGLGSLATQSGTFSGTSSGTNTGDQTIALTGDVTGSGTGTFAATLSASGVTAGTFTSVTVDAKGRVTAGTNPAAYSLPTATASVLGGIKIGSGLSIDGSGVVTAAGTYTLPSATTSVLGGVIVGTGLAVTSGTLSVSYGTTAGTAFEGNRLTYGTTFPATANVGDFFLKISP